MLTEQLNTSYRFKQTFAWRTKTANVSFYCAVYRTAIFALKIPVITFLLADDIDAVTTNRLAKLVHRNFIIAQRYAAGETAAGVSQGTEETS
jgi:hypothetical protein